MNQQQIDYADFLDKVFVDCPFDWSKATILARYIFKDIPLEGKDILDLGCGVATDRARFFLSEKRAAGYSGVDFCQLAVKASRIDSPRSRVLWADMQHLPFTDESYDIVYCRGAVTYAKDLPKTMKEAWRVLRPGGFFIVDFSRQTSVLFFARVMSWFLRHLPYVVKKKSSRFLAYSVNPLLSLFHGKKGDEDKKKIQQVLMLSVFSPSPARGISLGHIKQLFRSLGARDFRILDIPDSDVFSNKTTVMVAGTK